MKAKREEWRDVEIQEKEFWQGTAPFSSNQWSTPDLKLCHGLVVSLALQCKIKPPHLQLSTPDSESRPLTLNFPGFLLSQDSKEMVFSSVYLLSAPWTANLTPLYLTSWITLSTVKEHFTWAQPKILFLHCRNPEMMPVLTPIFKALTGCPKFSAQILGYGDLGPLKVQDLHRWSLKQCSLHFADEIVLVPNLCPEAITKLVGVENRRAHPFVCSFHVMNCNVFTWFFRKNYLVNFYLALAYRSTEELTLQ